MGDRFRLLVNVVDAIEQPGALPKLPVARALWKAQPSAGNRIGKLDIGRRRISSVFSQALTTDDMRRYGEMHVIEVLVIDDTTTLHGFRDALRWNDAFCRLNQRGG
ncbi:hypothetical protein LU631_14495 [Erwinia tracheiphila]|uniref:L-arabinose isomerase C-terminal domain-containing protein n=1 Tax=Erwinia tracheiphila TaxID=65700 RepID=A0A0M2KBH2_9GAMM|nr:L-arabinose isomerase [Erwinia tracheiphila]AXF75807.1 hypothetical protein AV903_06425 [Erwinia tracheiphila]EOS93308.1 L-arabinose isomerase [Erwinia tracheiphila PSU-1]KKF34588.1 hypothetical protein SY86_02550 [Erwinia tracheiphila]UIA85542.1 hypothetical protein LU604_12810 [Erwinia tracheiphila]UIA86259.1 hypothetical protein LU631_14495 [Erwinia tracheiphila]